MVAISGRGTSCGSHKWSGGPVVVAISYVQDQFTGVADTYVRCIIVGSQIHGIDLSCYDQEFFGAEIMFLFH